MARIFLVPVNDGEAAEIEKLLRSQKEKAVISKQLWGATWNGLEKPVIEEVELFLAQQPKAQVYGIELGGSARWNAINIDHHKYKDEDRSNDKSSLEQIADLLGIQLDRYQQLVAENDKGYIPAMKKFGATKEEIRLVREHDRLAQGVTPDDEAQAVRDIENAQWQGRKVVIWCPKGCSSAVTDRLFGLYDQALTIDGVNKKWIYFGPRHQDFYQLTEGGTEKARWAGGSPKSGFSGVENPDSETQEKIITFFWEK